MPMPQPENVNVDYIGEDSLAIEWKIGASRFHVWLEKKTRKPQDNTLYMNCPLGLTRGHPGYFETRSLRIDAKKNAPVVARALEIAHAEKLFDKAKEKLRAERQAEAEREAEEARAEKIRKAAPDLLAALLIARVYVEKATQTKPTEPARLQRQRQAVADAKAIQAAIDKATAP